MRVLVNEFAQVSGYDGRFFIPFEYGELHKFRMQGLVTPLLRQPLPYHHYRSLASARFLQEAG
jgi:hypothetical protein